MVHAPKPFSEAGPPLLCNGHSPLPLRPGSQVAFLKDWTRLANEPLTAAECERFARSPIPYNVGVALGYRGLVICDRDTDDPGVIEALRPVFLAIYGRGGVPVAKFGSKGLTTFFRWIDAEPFRNRSYVSALLGTFLELSGAGRSTTIPPSIHPKTEKPYSYRTARTLLDTRVDELPTLNAGDVAAIEAALAPFLPPAKPPCMIRPTITASDLDDTERHRHARYALAILEGEAAALAAMGENTGRNRAAFNLACRVGRYVHHGIIEHQHVVDPIVTACTANGLVREGRGALLKTINSGLLKAANDALPDLRSHQAGGRR